MQLGQFLAAIAVLSTGAVARAQEWPRYYLGVGVGRSDLGPNWDSVGVPELIQPNGSVDSEEGGWKVLAGWRPVRVVAAEIEYVDLGSAEKDDGRSPNSSAQNGFYNLKSNATAAVLTAVLFVPDRSPTFDVYGKLGVARLEESFDVSVQEYSPECRLPPPALGIQPVCIFDSQGNQTDTHPYVGIGARFKVANNWAVRVEYEEIDADIGDNTTLLSLGIAWER